MALLFRAPIFLLINFLRSLYRNLSAYIARKCASLNGDPKIATATLVRIVSLGLIITVLVLQYFNKLLFVSKFAYFVFE